MVNPIEHSKTKNTAMKYKVEPYIIPADVYGIGNLAGRGGWTWYTGSSSWMYIAGIKYILGLDIQDGYLSINPTISNQWKEYEIKYKYGESVYNIKVKNISKKAEKITMYLNGKIIDEGKLKLVDNGVINEIEVIL